MPDPAARDRRRGRFREAEQQIAETHAIGAEIGEPEAWTVFTAQSFALGAFEGRHAELKSTDEVSCNGVISRGPVAAYAGKLLTLLGRYDEAGDRLLDALTTVEAFGWEYYRASTLVALVDNRVRQAGGLDAEANQLLTEAEALCEQYGFGSWARRAAAIRTRLHAPADR